MKGITVSGREKIQRISAGEIALQELPIGETIAGPCEQNFRLVGRMSADEAFHAVILKHPWAFVETIGVKAVDMTPLMLHEYETFRRVWPIGTSIVVAVDLTLRTITVISRSSFDYFALKSMRIANTAIVRSEPVAS